MNPVVYIFADSAAYSGVDVLFERLALYLITKGRKVFIVEKPGGVLSSRLAGNCTILDATTDTPKEIGCVVCNFSRIGKAVMWAKPIEDMRILVWYLQPNDIFSTYFPLAGTASRLGGFSGLKLWIRLQFWQYWKLRKLVNLMTQGKGFINMDGACGRSLDYFLNENIAEKCVLIPIPVPPRPRTARAVAMPQSPLILGYLGRMDAVKYSAIKPLLQQISIIGKQRNIPIEMSFVGCGPMENALEAECVRLGITLTNHGFQHNDKAIEILAKEANIGIAMGTAALDLASIGIPTIIIDPSLNLNTPAQTKYRFVHEIEDQSLGEYRDMPLYCPGLHSLETIVELLMKWPELSIAGNEYVTAKHNTYNIMKSTLASIDECTSTIKDIYKLAQKLERYINFFRRLWAKQFIVEIDA